MHMLPWFQISLVCRLQWLFWKFILKVHIHLNRQNIIRECCQRVWVNSVNLSKAMSLRGCGEGVNGRIIGLAGAGAVPWAEDVEAGRRELDLDLDLAVAVGAQLSLWEVAEVVLDNESGSGVRCSALGGLSIGWRVLPAICTGKYSTLTIPGCE